MRQRLLTSSNSRKDFLLLKGLSNSSENAVIADSFPEIPSYESFDPRYSIIDAQTVLLSRGAGGQYRLVPYSSIFCSSDRSIGSQGEGGYGQGD
jgi:hypothetical protein